ELDAVLRHRGEDRIAGAVDDSISRALAIAGQRLAQGADDRHAAADACLETDRQATPPGLAENLAAMLCEQSFVRGNDVLARRQSLHDQCAGWLVAAKQLDHD